MTLPYILMLAVAGFIISFFLILIGKKLAPFIGLVDAPDTQKGGRKNHLGVIPLIGGLIIIPVYTALIFFSDFYNTLPFTAVLIATFVLLLVGLEDDRAHIIPWARFIIQIWVASFLVVHCGAELHNLGNLFGFGAIDLGWGGKIFSVICFVLLMNAINMLDGVDGLVGSFMLAALGWISFAFWSVGQDQIFYTILLLLVPIIAFLVFNARYPYHKKASIFLGDAGSLTLALLLGYFAIIAANEQIIEGVLPPVSIIWIMTLPIVDTFAVFFVRVKQGRSPFDADRLHAHYKLIDYGFSPGQTTLILFLFSVLTGAIGVFAPRYGVPEYILLYSWSVIWLGYTAHRLKHA